MIIGGNTMNDAVLKTLKQKDYIVKSFLFKIASELKLSTSEVLLLIYFLNQDRPSFDIEKIKSELFLDEEEIKGAYSKLITTAFFDFNCITISSA